MKFLSTILALGAIVGTVILSGCASAPVESKVMHANHRAADQLIRQLQARERGSNPSDITVLVTTLVNVSNIQQTTSLSQISSEQIASRMVQYGFKVLEVKLRNSLSVTQRGEFLLSRDAKQLADQAKANYALVGTFANDTASQSENQMTTIRLVNVKTGLSVASVDYLLPLP